MGEHVDDRALWFDFVGLIVNVQIMRQLLQLAAAAANTGCAAGIMLAENQPQIGPAGRVDPGTVGFDVHAV